MRRQRRRGSVAAGNRLEYEKRVNRVIDHIREHLAHELTLAALARVAAFSPFHFHRVFAAITGETLFEFIHRQRIEKAAGALLSHRDQSILAVALDHGFSSAAGFSRAFRAHFHLSATQWPAGGAAPWRARQGWGRNPGQQVRNQGKARGRPRSDTPRTSRGGRPRIDTPRATRGGRPRTDTPRRSSEEAPMNVHVRQLPAHHVAYMRYVGPYGP